MNQTCQNFPQITLGQLQNVLPETPLYGQVEPEISSLVGWQLSPSPYPLTTSQVETLHEIGFALFSLFKATDSLYKASLKEEAMGWIQQLFNAGKPPELIRYAQMNRFKNQFPLVIRPDLLVTETGFSLCEVDAVPGGLGFTGALQQAYSALGFDLLAAPEGLPKAFLEMLLRNAPQEQKEPMIALVVSDEASDYRLELQWLVNHIQTFYPKITLIHPKELLLERQQLGYLDQRGQFVSIQILYRFFELFDLPNIPQIELIQYAVKKGLVYCTPPFKPHLEEKLVLALVHYPFLEDFWRSQLGEAHFSLLKTLIPESWILDPAPLPPMSQVTPPLVFQDKASRDFSQLSTLTQKQRELVIKPSGFSPLAWGSRGVSIGHDLSHVNWQEALDNAFSSFHHTPYLLQRFKNTKVEPYTFFNSVSGQIESAEGRTRLCPYYFVTEGTPRLSGVLATTCPKNKKIIHGMREGVMRPAMPSDLF